jgi:hypothetical protein
MRTKFRAVTMSIALAGGAVAIAVGTAGSALAECPVAGSGLGVAGTNAICQTGTAISNGQQQTGTAGTNAIVQTGTGISNGQTQLGTAGTNALTQLGTGLGHVLSLGH